MADPSIQIQIVPDILIPFLTVFIGAFLGAIFAYKNERKVKKQERRDADIAAVLETTLCLQMMWKEVLDYRKQIIEPVRNDQIRFITMQSIIYFETKHEIPWPRLVFLMEKCPNLLGEISNVQFAFRQLFELVNLRSERHMREVLPKLAFASETATKNATAIEKVFTEVSMLNLLGKNLFQSMKNNTEEIIKYADRLFEEFSPLLDKLRKATTDIYCDANIPAAREPSESDTTDKPNSSG